MRQQAASESMISPPFVVGWPAARRRWRLNGRRTVSVDSDAWRIRRMSQHGITQQMTANALAGLGFCLLGSALAGIASASVLIALVLLLV
jgi:hypothetical protein